MRRIRLVAFILLIRVSLTDTLPRAVCTLTGAEQLGKHGRGRRGGPAAVPLEAASLALLGRGRRRGSRGAQVFHLGLSVRRSTGFRGQRRRRPSTRTRHLRHYRSTNYSRRIEYFHPTRTSNINKQAFISK